MNQLAAMRDTLALAKANGHDEYSYEAEGVDYDHLASMLARADYGHQSGTFSEAKLGRWLGYVQGVLVAQKMITLDEAKDINRRHAL